MSSLCEREIRDAVVARLRELMPTARIVHELNVAGQGTNRIDVAAVTETEIAGVEIKSERDVLKRLDDQWPAFRKVCNVVVIAAHEKHFKPWRDPSWRDDVEPYVDLHHPLFFGNYALRDLIWRYPRPERERFPGTPWSLRNHWWKPSLELPLRSADLLGMLWASELQAECRRHGIDASSRATRDFMLCAMALAMTGDEVRRAVCRQLRARAFAEADAPIVPPGLRAVEQSEPMR